MDVNYGEERSAETHTEYLWSWVRELVTVKKLPHNFKILQNFEDLFSKNTVEVIILRMQTAKKIVTGLAVFTLVLTVGLVSALAITEPVKAQYPSYSYPSTTSTPTTTSTPVPTATSSGTSIVLYEGPLSTGSTSSLLFGFGNTATNITSPGPTLYLQEGTTYTMTIYNVGTSPHAWEIVSTKAVSNSPMFGAGIDITNFLPAGNSASVTFTANQTGSFYYVCTEPGHIGYGMWGNVVVSSTVPEFPSPLMLLFTMLVAVVLSVFLVHQRIKTKQN